MEANTSNKTRNPPLRQRGKVGTTSTGLEAAGIAENPTAELCYPNRDLLTSYLWLEYCRIHGAARTTSTAESPGITRSWREESSKGNYGYFTKARGHFKV